MGPCFESKGKAFVPDFLTVGVHAFKEDGVAVECQYVLGGYVVPDGYFGQGFAASFESEGYVKR